MVGSTWQGDQGDQGDRGFCAAYPGAVAGSRSPTPRDTGCGALALANHRRAEVDTGTVSGMVRLGNKPRPRCRKPLPRPGCARDICARPGAECSLLLRLLPAWGALGEGQLASRIKTSPPRVPKIERAAPDVSLDQMLRAFAAAGGRITLHQTGPSPTAKA
jgi:hypothetical protein